MATKPRMGAVEGWAVTHDGETLKSGFASDVDAMHWLHRRHSYSVDHAVRHEGYDIVLVEGGVVRRSYKRDVLGRGARLSGPARARPFEEHKRKGLRQRWVDGEVTVEHWFERDRAFVGIQEADSGEYLAEWWDDDVANLFDGGEFYSPGIGFRIPSELEKFKRSVVDYAESTGVKAYRGPIRRRT